MLPATRRLARRVAAPANTRLTACLALGLALVVAPAGLAAQVPDPPPVVEMAPEPLARGLAAIERLGDLLPEVAAAHGTIEVDLISLLLADGSLAVDRAGRLVSIDPPAAVEDVVVLPSDVLPVEFFTVEILPVDEEPVEAEPVDEEPVEAEPVEDEPVEAEPVIGLASRPGAAATIHLDFDGHVGVDTFWNQALDQPVVDAEPFDLDGDPDRWSEDELEMITDVWAAVADEFAPWGVNVTTVEPVTPPESVEGTGLQVRVVMTADTFLQCGCGGLAYLGTVDGPSGQPAFVFNVEVEGMVEAAIHQVDHVLGLFHDQLGDTDAVAEARAAGLAPDPVPDGPVPDPEPSDPTEPAEPEEPVELIEAGDPAVEGAPAAPVGLIGFQVEGDVVLGWAPSPEAEVVDYRVGRADRSGGPYEVVATVPVGFIGYQDPDPLVGDGHYVVVARDGDGNRSAPSAEVVVIFDPPIAPAPAEPEPEPVPEPAEPEPVEPEPVPVEPFEWPAEPIEPNLLEEEVVVVEPGALTGDPGPLPDGVTVADGETPVYGALVGDPSLTHHADGVGQRITETPSGGAVSARHDRLDHRWSVPAGEGNQLLRVVATAGPDGGDFDEGIAVEWSTDRVEWQPLTVIPFDGTIDEFFDIGAPVGVVHVRVVDTDRTPRQNSVGWVEVDLIQVIGDGLEVEPRPDPTEVRIEARFHLQGIGQGDQAAVVRVTATDDLEERVGGVEVDVAVSGDIDETVTLVTDSSGSASAQTEGAAFKPAIEICVVSVRSGELVWLPDELACPA